MKQAVNRYTETEGETTIRVLTADGNQMDDTETGGDALVLITQLDSRVQRPWRKLTSAAQIKETRSRSEGAAIQKVTVPRNEVWDDSEISATLVAYYIAKRVRSSTPACVPPRRLHLKARP